MKLFNKIFKKKKDILTKNFELFKVRFQSYLELLNNNYNALNIISDLEEKSQGEYVFDINYLKSTIVKLQKNINDICRSLIIIGGNKYSSLQNIVNSIISKINTLLNPELTFSDEIFTIPFDKINVEMNNYVGSKNANLCEIKNFLNLPTPNGFAITTLAYIKILEENKIQDNIYQILNRIKINDFTSLKNLSEQIQELINNVKIPDKIENSIISSYNHIFGENSKTLVSLRSSSVAEDSFFSFAGQYATFLGVTKETIIENYKKVIASKFKPNVIFYLLSHNLKENDMLMSVSCVEMVNSRSSGVIYTRDPINTSNENLIINSIWGQGKLLVDGSITPDNIIYSRKYKKILQKNISYKDKKLILNTSGGVHLVSTNDFEKNKCSIDDNEIEILIKSALKIEEYYSQPQDIEWAIDMEGNVYFLQTRPLRIFTPIDNSKLPDMAKAEILTQGGTCASPGAAIGKIFIIKSNDDLNNLPANSVIIAQNPLPGLIQMFDKAKAIVTQFGGVASHFVTIAREYNIPTIVGMNDLSMFTNNTLVTVDATNTTIYLGEFPELVEALKPELDYYDSNQTMITFNKILNYISPLSLINPNSKEFTINNCKSLHDIIRFSHQKAIEEMFNAINNDNINAFQTIPLKSSIPLKLNIIYLDKNPEDLKRAYITIDSIESIPLEQFWKGIIDEGWTLPYINPNIRGFMSIVGTELTNQKYHKLAEKSYAIVSKDYMLLNLRMGYHYSTIEAISTNISSKNFIKMQFKEGGASFDRRIRRINLLKQILIDYGFEVSSKNDFFECSISYLDSEKINERLYLLGRLTMLTKQLDVALDDDETAENFLNEIKMKLSEN